MTMSIMDPDKLPKKPAVASRAAADAEFNHWLRENNFDRLKDGDGQVWTLDLQVTRLPEPAEHEASWTLTLNLTTVVTVASLIETKVLDPQEDVRLMELLGDQSIAIALKPIQHKAMTRDDARRLLVKILPETRAKIEGGTFRDVKRSLIGRWVDQSRVFGAGRSQDY